MAVQETKENKEEVLWMADCYSLAKRFPQPHVWLSLLKPESGAQEISPFHYWLWMEIWKAAQVDEAQAQG